MILEENHKVFPSKQQAAGETFFLVVTEKDVS